MTSESDSILIVDAAYARDMGRGIARIGEDDMNMIDATAGEIVEIQGKRKTVAVCLPLYSSDAGKKIIRIDSIIRTNSACVIGDSVAIKKILTKPAQSVSVSTKDEIPAPVDESYLRSVLTSIPITKGDYVIVPYYSTRLKFRVDEFLPSNDAVLITPNTAFVINSQTADEFRTGSNPT